MQDTNTYLMIFRPNRDDFVATMTPEEKGVMGAHVARCQELGAQGKVVLLGVCPDGAYGIMVFRAGSEDEAWRIFDEDPAVKAGIVTPELHPFIVAIP